MAPSLIGLSTGGGGSFRWPRDMPLRVDSIQSERQVPSFFWRRKECFILKERAAAGGLEDLPPVLQLQDDRLGVKVVGRAEVNLDVQVPQFECEFSIPD